MEFTCRKLHRFTEIHDIFRRDIFRWEICGTLLFQIVFTLPHSYFDLLPFPSTLMILAFLTRCHTFEKPGILPQYMLQGVRSFLPRLVFTLLRIFYASSSPFYHFPELSCSFLFRRDFTLLKCQESSRITPTRFYAFFYDFRRIIQEALFAALKKGLCILSKKAVALIKNLPIFKDPFLSTNDDNLGDWLFRSPCRLDGIFVFFFC